MPYIKQDDRSKYENELQNLVDKVVDINNKDESITSLCGHLNYLISSLLKRTYNQLNSAKSGKQLELKYFEHNEIIGILECAKLEWYTHLSSPYEKKKIIENGDI